MGDSEEAVTLTEDEGEIAEDSEIAPESATSSCELSSSLSSLSDDKREEYVPSRAEYAAEEPAFEFALELLELPLGMAQLAQEIEKSGDAKPTRSHGDPKGWCFRGRTKAKNG